MVKVWTGTVTVGLKGERLEDRITKTWWKKGKIVDSDLMSGLLVVSLAKTSDNAII